jgi:hypothetical protein
MDKKAIDLDLIYILQKLRNNFHFQFSSSAGRALRRNEENSEQYANINLGGMYVSNLLNTAPGEIVFISVIK